MQYSIIPEQKIRQAFDLFLSLRNLIREMPEWKREFDYKFEVDEISAVLWMFSRRDNSVVKHIIAWPYEPESRIDELIDMIEEELDAARSHRNEQVGRRD